MSDIVERNGVTYVYPDGTGYAGYRYTTPRLARVFFEHRGRRYEACRFLGGRVELYRIDPTDGISMWMRYAVARRSDLDAKAVQLLGDELDPAAREAAFMLARGVGYTGVEGAICTRKVLALVHTVDAWGRVQYEITKRSRLSGAARTYRAGASLRLFSVIDPRGKPVRYGMQPDETFESCPESCHGLG